MEGVSIKIVYSDKKTGRTSQTEVPKESEVMLIGKQVGEVVEGAMIGLDGYRLKVTGLSDKTGAPSRKEVEGSRKSFLLLGSGAGIRRAKKGKRLRKLIRGNTISVDTEQINTVIEAYGAKSAEEIFPKKEKAVKEEKKEA